MAETIVLDADEARLLAYQVSNSIMQHAAFIAHSLADPQARTETEEVATLVAVEELLSDLADANRK